MKGIVGFWWVGWFWEDGGGGKQDVGLEGGKRGTLSVRGSFESLSGVTSLMLICSLGNGQIRSIGIL